MCVGVYVACALLLDCSVKTYTMMYEIIIYSWVSLSKPHDSWLNDMYGHGKIFIHLPKTHNLCPLTQLTLIMFAGR